MIMKFKESSLLKKHKQLLGNKRDKRKKVVKSTSPTPDLKKAVIKKQEGGTLFSIYNSIDPYIPPTIDFNAPELETEIVTNPIKKRQAKVIEEAKKSTANSEVQELKEINSEIPSKKIPKSSETWKSPYSNKNEWVSGLTNAYKKAGITNDNAIRMLISQDALESGWGRSAQGKFNFGNLTTGSSWKGAYVEGKDHDAKGNPIKQRFRAYDSMDEYAADKIQFLKRLYDFDENDDIDKFISKLSGANKGKRRYAEATNYATSLANVYNKFAEGGIIKAQNGSKSEELLVKKALEFGQKTSEKMSPYDVRLIDFIKSKEGFRPKPEKDKTDGKWTVGYGLTDPKLIRKYRNGITEEEASKHLIQHLQMGADSLATMPYYDNLNLGEKTALNDLIYNVGWNKFKNSKRLQSHLRTGNDAGAKKEMNHGEHQARGLKIRRNQNRQMYDSTFSWKYKKGGVAKYQPGGKTYTGSTSTNYYGDVVHHLPVWNKDGETNVGLPEVVVTPRNNLNLGEAVNRGRNAAGNVGKEILSAVTPLGDIESAKGIYNDATSGNYGSAAVGLGLLALPNFIKKPLKIARRIGTDYAMIAKDAVGSPKRFIQARNEGTYPLTYKERRSYLENVHRKGETAASRVNSNNQEDLNFRYTVDPEGGHQFEALEGANSKYTYNSKSYKNFDDPKTSDGVNSRAWNINSHIKLRQSPNSKFLKHPNETAFTTAHELQHSYQNGLSDIRYMRGNGDSPSVTEWHEASSALTPLKKNVGTWEGDPLELNSEVMAYRAALGAPRYNLMTPEQQSRISEAIKRTFGLNSGETHNMLNELGKLGYRSGGKL